MAGVTLVPLGVELIEVEEVDKAVARAGLGVHPSHVSCSTEQSSVAGCEAKRARRATPSMWRNLGATATCSNEIRRVAA